MKKIYAFFSTFLPFLLVMTTSASMAQTDAGMTVITEPTAPICPGTHPVRAVLHNYGPDSLLFVTIQWNADGVVQTPYLYTDTLLGGEEDTITLGSYPFVAATTHSLFTFTENPNGSVDADPSNDTATVSGLVVYLNGTYTVGGASPDFPTIDSAVSTLNTYGVCGPVRLDVRPVIDTIKVVLNAISGSSAVNTLTIRAENGDSTSVKFTQPSANFGANDYLIRLSGSDHVTLSHLTLERTGTANLQHVIDFTNGACHNVISNCRIIGGAPLGTSTQAALLYSSSLAASNDTSNTFTNNYIQGGSYGIYMNGLSAVALEAGNVATNNILVNQNARGIHFNFQRDPFIEGNTISSTTTNTAYAGIYLLRDQGAVVVSKNKVSAAHGFGLYLNTCTSNAVTPALILNNFFTGADSAAIRVLASNYQNILNNSALIEGNGLAVFYISGTGSGNIIQNNILMNNTGGYAYVAGSFATNGVLLSDYNDLYTTGTNVGRYGGADMALLSDWTLVTGQDINSVSVNPQFISSADLHASAAALDNLGQVLGYVPDDIDGEVRSGATPDIGADEFTAGSHDLAVTAWLSPADSSCGEASLQVSVIVSNLGGVPASGFNVRIDVSGLFTAQLSQLYTGTLQPGSTDTVALFDPQATNPGGSLVYSAYTDYAFDDNHGNDTITGIINLLPVPIILIAEGSVCGGGQVVLSVTAVDSVDWYDAPVGGNLLFTGNPFTTPLLSNSTTYFASVRNPCAGGRFPVTAHVYSPAVVFLGNDTIVSDSLVLDAGAGFITYAWSTLDSSQTITVLASGTYFVTVTDFNGCTGTDTIDVTILTGLKDPSQRLAVFVYPNPAREVARIVIHNQPSGPMDLVVYNNLGQQVYADYSQSFTGEYSLPVKGWPSGIYMLELKSGNRSTTMKLLVQ